MVPASDVQGRNIDRSDLAPSGLEVLSIDHQGRAFKRRTRREYRAVTQIAGLKCPRDFEVPHVAAVYAVERRVL